MVKFLNVVVLSTKYNLNPTVVESSMSVSSNHAPVALTSMAANPMFAVSAPVVPVPRTVKLVKSAVS